MTQPTAPSPQQLALLFHFCRLQLPGITLAPEVFQRHLQRTFELFKGKAAAAVSWSAYLENLSWLDWYLCCSCLQGDTRAWELLFAARAGRTDCLLVDALRARAVRLYPGDEERQDGAVTEFWGHLLVAETEGSVPILARYDGQRPLVPWLIRVFQNWHISRLRQRGHMQALPDDDVALPLPVSGDSRWHDEFCLAARAWLDELGESDLLLLGLRLRYRLSQREVAALLGVHEGTISRQTSQLRDRCLESIDQRLRALGWTGDDLSGYVLNEMGHLITDEPRLSADRLAGLLAARGKSLPRSVGGDAS